MSKAKQSGILWLAALSTACATAGESPVREVPNSEDRVFFGGESISLIGDARMDDLAYWSLNYVWSGAADVGEVFTTARRIEPGNAQSWYDEWTRTARRLEEEGDRSRARGHHLSAGASYLRASRYYRAALSVYDDANAPQLMVAARKGVDTFVASMELLPYDMTRVEIPYEDTALPGYLFRSPVAVGPAPALIIQSGWDSWPEDEKHFFDGALERGYHVLLFHGPGQGMALRERGLTFRPDWQAVVGPVIDFLSAQPGVDAERIGMVGVSFGSYLLPQAAAHEPRLKACIMNPGAIDYSALATSLRPPELNSAFEVMAPDDFDRYVAEYLETAPTLRPLLQHSMNVLGANSPSESFAKTREYGRIQAEKVGCNALILDGTRDFFGDQAKQLYDALKGPKEYMLFTEREGGTLHCRQGVTSLMTQRTFDWLDENL